MPASNSAVGRRQPMQRRARQTVDAILEAVLRVLKREGLQAITTNRIAEVAGVSIGSVYQYFPDKHAIFGALHQRHVEEMDRLVESTLVRHASAPLEELICALIESLAEAHAANPELHELLSAQVPGRAGGGQSFATRLQGAVRLAIAANQVGPRSPRDLEKAVFIVHNMIDALSHAMLHRPAQMTLAAAKEEAVAAIMAYLRAQNG